MKPQPPFTILQNIFKRDHPPIQVTPCHELALTPYHIQQFIDSANDRVIGLAPAYASNGVLCTIALASSERVLLVFFSKNQPRKGKCKNGRDLLHDLVLCADSHTKYAFKMDGVASALCLDFAFRITKAVDVLSAAQDSRDSLGSLLSVLGGEEGVNRPNLTKVFSHDEDVSEPREHVALRAWAAWRAATTPSMIRRLAEVPRIDTRAFCETVSLHARFEGDPSNQSPCSGCAYCRSSGAMRGVSPRPSRRASRTRSTGKSLVARGGSLPSLPRASRRVSSRTETRSVHLPSISSFLDLN